MKRDYLKGSRVLAVVTIVAVVAVGGVVAGAACAARPGSGSGSASADASGMQVPDSARLMRTIGVLAHDSMEGRAVGTQGGVKARRFLTSELMKRGVKPFQASGFEQTFRFAGRGANADSTTGTNLIGVIRGSKYPNRYIVVSAHYDHLGTRNGEVFNGADDNASGTAGILEVASWFAAHKPQHSIIIAHFDAEERGSQGSRAFIASSIMPPRDSVIMNINLDMVGRNEANELYAAGTTPYPFLLPYVETARTRSGIIKLLTGHDGNPGQQNWTGQSDHGPFHAVKIPYLYFGEEDHPDYHKASDEIQGIMPGFYVAAIRIVLDIAKQADANPPVRTASSGAAK